MESNKFLKITGILMTICGAIGIVFGIIALIVVGVLAVAPGASSGLFTLAVILALISSAVKSIAGIAGVKNAAKPEKTQTYIIFGIMVVILSLPGTTFNLVEGNSFITTSFITELVIPVLYLIAAFQNKKELPRVLYRKKQKNSPMFNAQGFVLFCSSLLF